MGPLEGIRVVEVASLAAGPFAGMLLADYGAEVLRVERPPSTTGSDPAVEITRLLSRGRPAVAIDLKRPEGVAALLRLTDAADVLIEGFRPGVLERLGAGPDVCMARNPRLVYGRVTGWGQSGPLAHVAGHDIDFIALSGALHAIGRRRGGPVPPLNLIGDFAGGGLLLLAGVMAALIERQRSGEGQIVDAAMLDGAALLMTMFHGLRGTPAWTHDRRSNLLDGGAPFYRTYETKDGKYVAVGALEPKFYAELLALLGLEPDELPGQMDQAGWPRIAARFAEVFRQKTRDEWGAIFDGSDACCVPVLTLDEAVAHPHAVARDGYVGLGEVCRPAPAPRFSRTPGSADDSATATDPEGALAGWGFSAEEVERLRLDRVVTGPSSGR